MSFFDTYGNNGDIVSQMLSDVLLIQSALREKVGNYIHNMLATFFSGIVIGFVNCWQIALITLATGPFIVAAGGISNIFLHRLAENIQDAYAEVASIAEQRNMAAKILQRAIWLMAMVIFLGTLMIWIMSPTKTYKQIWSPKIKSKVNNTTYFGTQATNLLIFTFPILLIATLGTLYLHLGKKKHNDHKKTSSEEERKDLFGRWRSPMIVKGPLGIVSWIELSFLLMFIALLVWCFSTYLQNGFATITTKSAAKQGLKVWQMKLEEAAVFLGVVGNISLAFLFFPVTRGSSVLPLFGLTSESSVKFHIWLGHIVLTLFTVHGICYIIFWAAIKDISQMQKWEKTDVANVAGEISLLAGLILWVTTYPGIRRKFFELFLYAHHLYILFVVFFVLHVGISYTSMMLPGFYLFLVDRFVRFLPSRQNVRLVSARVLSCETFELNFAKNPSLSFDPTSILFVNVPGISKLQWHPFTITSNNNLEPEKLSIVVKGDGSWSRKLHQMLSSPTIEHLEIAIEGPYGPVSTNFLRHETLVMVSGGSGITPFISIIREIIFASSVSKCKTPKILLICAFKTYADLTMLDLLLPFSGTESDISNLKLQVEAYVTREKQPTTDQHSKKSQIIWFKPKPTDSPVSPILGPNGWLWLGAIIAASFLIFFIIIGLITSHLIYPTDHNTNDVFSWSIRATINMLFICVTIAITSSVAVFWNKKQNAKQAKQIQNMELSMPQASPYSLSFNAERELESLPQQSIMQATNIYYGQRPNLKKAIFNCEGSSIGVLVSGPKELRHDVANICASGLVENLHFESISFSW